MCKYYKRSRAERLKRNPSGSLSLVGGLFSCGRPIYPLWYLQGEAVCSADSLTAGGGDAKARANEMGKSEVVERLCCAVGRR